jgi:hypothetical protein
MNKRLTTLCLLLAIAWPAAAVEEGQVIYLGGTAPTLKEGAIGRLDTSSSASLKFESAGGKLEIPFAKIDSYTYSQEVARHLGVLPAMVVGMVKKRQRRHFFRISFHDEANAPQVAVFEVPKQMPKTLLAVLQARAPQSCKPLGAGPCAQPIRAPANLRATPFAAISSLPD